MIITKKQFFIHVNEFYIYVQKLSKATIIICIFIAASRGIMCRITYLTVVRCAIREDRRKEISLLIGTHYLDVAELMDGGVRAA